MKLRYYDKLVKRITKHILTIAEKNSMISWDAYLRFFDELKEDVRQELYTKSTRNER